MGVYWAMFAVPAFFSLYVGPVADIRKAGSRYLFGALFLVFVVLVGLRYEVGADWFIYQIIVDAIAYEPFSYSMSQGDPAFNIVTWLFTRVGIFEQGPTFVCGSILMYGIWQFVIRQSHPWLCFTVAVPYLIIVVGMGYVRQGAAIGFLLLALVAFQEMKVGKASALLIAAMSFHISAILVLPFAALAIARRRPAAVVGLVLVGIPFLLVILIPRLTKLESEYISQEMQSSGAGVRLFMNAVPAVLFLAFRKHFNLNEMTRTFWTLVSGFSILLFLLVLRTEATTAFDRVALYFIPLQLFVYGNLSTAVTKDPAGQQVWALGIVGLYTFVLGTWLFFAVHAEYWLPYHSVLTS